MQPISPPVCSSSHTSSHHNTIKGERERRKDGLRPLEIVLTRRLGVQLCCCASRVEYSAFVNISLGFTTVAWRQFLWLLLAWTLATPSALGPTILSSILFHGIGLDPNCAIVQRQLL